MTNDDDDDDDDDVQHIQGEHKKYPYTTFVDISAMREDFYVTFYNNVKQ